MLETTHSARESYEQVSDWDIELLVYWGFYSQICCLRVLAVEPLDCGDVLKGILFTWYWAHRPLSYIVETTKPQQAVTHSTSDAGQWYDADRSTTVQNADAHLIMGLSCCDHIHNALMPLHWLAVMYTIGFKSTLQMYLVFISKCPHYQYISDSESPPSQIMIIIITLYCTEDQNQTERQSLSRCWTYDLEQPTAVRSWCRGCRLL